ncbi:Cof-type HAD-IIB family hydrolase [Cryobacterium sp.]|jgi:Cof subfamily protein (haloacid dehalogenase superfamily)|uniref:Cof-type HAD-IIB family hydrolase n=1 Tax=Cryobacterium sp. TaxID=1926290 RepID=UPI002606296D|nr:Cof-type HAD-IIB family hydrolase [Cryobacterium sp.]MCU1446964.1 family hydrolase [Cryobacterium sp.]
MTSAIPVPIDIRLIASDMDGTLLDADGRVPDRFWPLLDKLLAAGILFSPASGRQYQTLQAVFGDRDGLVYIAENGTNIVQGGVTIALEPVVPSIVAPVVDWVRATAAAGTDLGIVVCGARSAYIERADDSFVAQVRPYYAALEVVDDVTVAAANDDVLKLAIFDRGRAETRTGPAVRALDLSADVVISGDNWVDIMRPGANKGTALIRLQEHLGISREQTMAFGDFLNDAEMLDAAGHSYAVANAHPSIRKRARHLAPSNIDEGVIESILGVFPELAPALA